MIRIQIQYSIPIAVEFAVVSIPCTMTVLSSIKVTHTLAVPSFSLMTRLKAPNSGPIEDRDTGIYFQIWLNLSIMITSGPQTSGCNREVAALREVYDVWSFATWILN